MNTEKEHGNTSLMLSCPPKDKFDYALWISKKNGGYICYLTGYSLIYGIIKKADNHELIPHVLPALRLMRLAL